MKLILTTLMSCFFWVYAQSDQVLVEVFGAEKIAQMKKDNPGKYAYYLTFVTDGVEIIDELQSNKKINYVSLSNLKYRNDKSSKRVNVKNFYAEILRDKSKIIKYNISPTKGKQLIQLNNGKVLLIRSKDEIVKMVNQKFK